MGRKDLLIRFASQLEQAHPWRIGARQFMREMNYRFGDLTNRALDRWPTESQRCC